MYPSTDIYAPLADPSALPELPADWRDMHVLPPPVELVPPPAAPADAALPPVPPEQLPSAPEPTPDGRFVLDAPASLPELPLDRWYAEGVDQAQPANDQAAPQATQPPVEAQPGPTVDQNADALVAQGPEAVALEGFKRQMASEDRLADAHLTELRKLNGERSKAFETYQKTNERALTEMNAIADERRALATQRIDSRWFSNKSTGQQFAGYLLATASGILNPKGANPALAFLQGEIDRDVEEQKANIAHQRGMLNDRQSAVEQLFAQNGDLFRSGETVRLAMFDSAIEQLKSEEARLDPKGSSAQRLATFKLSLLQARAAQEEKSAEALRKRAVEAAELELKKRNQAEQERNNRSQNAVAWANSKNSRNQTALEAAKEGLIPDGKGGFKQDPNFKKNLKPQDAKAALELEQAKRGEILTDSQGNVLGKPRGISEEARGKLRETVASYESFRPQLTKLLDHVKALGTKYGGVGSERWSSDERKYYETLRSELASSYARVKQPTGILTDADIERAAKPIPAVDTWTRNSNPEATYKAVTELMDSAFDTSMRVNVDGFDPAKSPTKRYQAADKVILSGKVDADSPDDLLNQAKAPLWSGATTEEKADYVGNLGRLYKEINRRRDNWTPAEILEVSKALDAQKDSLTPEQYQALRTQLLSAVRDK